MTKENSSKLGYKGYIGRDNNVWYCLNCGAVWDQTCKKGFVPESCPLCNDKKYKCVEW